MQFSTAFIAATVAVLASASPIANAPGTIDKTWLVTDWEAGCGHGGCFGGSFATPFLSPVPYPCTPFSVLLLVLKLAKLAR